MNAKISIILMVLYASCYKPDSTEIKPLVTDLSVSPTRQLACFVVPQKKPYQSFDIRIWSLDLLTGKATPVTSDASIAFCSVSPDDSFVAYFGHNNTVHIIDRKTLINKQIANSNALFPFTGTGWVSRSSLRISPNGKYIGYVEKKTLRVYDIQSDTTTTVVAGIVWDNWEWLGDGEEIIYNNEARISRVNVRSLQSTFLYAPTISKKEEFEYAYFTRSPDPSLVAIYVHKTLWSLNLQTARAVPLFECDHYHVGFDWGDHGILYLDALNGERRSMAKLMVYDHSTGTSKELLTGPFAFPAWTKEGNIVVRYNRSQVMLINYESKVTRVLYDASVGKPNKGP